MKAHRWIDLAVGAALFCSSVAVGGETVSARGGMTERAEDSSGAECAFRPGQLIAPGGLSDAISSHLGVNVRERASLVPEGLKHYYPAGIPLLSLYQFSGADPLLAAASLQGAGISASPNYLYNFAPGGGVRTWAPGEDAKPAYGPYPTVGAPWDGEGTRIGILDTGFNRKAMSLIPGAGPISYVSAASRRLELAARGLISPTYVQPSELTQGRAAGHGTFIAGLVRRVLPAAAIRVAQVPLVDVSDEAFTVDVDPVFATDASTRADDAALTYMLYTAFVGNDPYVDVDVLSLSFGSYGCHRSVEPDAGDGDFRTPLGLRNGLLALWEMSGGRLTVAAAAGNDLTDDYFYPAAFAAYDCFDPASYAPGPRGVPCFDKGTAVSPWLAAVTSSPSSNGSYSNYGAWTTLEGIGSDVGSVRHDSKWWSWSGTSFAAPCVAAVAAVNPGTDWTTMLGKSLDCRLS